MTISRLVTSCSVPKFPALTPFESMPPSLARSRQMDGRQEAAKRQSVWTADHCTNFKDVFKKGLKACYFSADSWETQTEDQDTWCQAVCKAITHADAIFPCLPLLILSDGQQPEATIFRLLSLLFNDFLSFTPVTPML